MARTLFATHYHELTVLSESIKGVKNLNVDVAEQNGNIVFLHKIVEGSASRSYGIHVAKLAGVPKVVLDAAETKLAELEAETSAVQFAPAGLISDTDKTVEKGSAASGNTSENAQISLFNFGDSVIAQKIRNIDLMNITPSQAIRILEELKEEADRI